MNRLKTGMFTTDRSKAGLLVLFGFISLVAIPCGALLVFCSVRSLIVVFRGSCLTQSSPCWRKTELVALFCSMWAIFQGWFVLPLGGIFR